MLERMLVEWDRWVESLAGVRTLKAWQRDQALAGWEAADLRCPWAGDRTDRMQAALVARAQRGEEAASLTLLVQFRPALHRLVSRRRRGRAEPGVEVTADVVATFIEVALTHDLQRRPARIAANLVWDTRQRLDRADRRGGDRDQDQSFVEPTSVVGPATIGDEGWVGALDLVASVAGALDTLSGNESSLRLTRELAFRAWFVGESNADLARGLGLEPSAVRARLCRLRAVVRDHYQLDEAAAA